jgi:hypothetical protein
MLNATAAEQARADVAAHEAAKGKYQAGITGLGLHRQDVEALRQTQIDQAKIDQQERHAQLMYRAALARSQGGLPSMALDNAAVQKTSELMLADIERVMQLPPDKLKGLGADHPDFKMYSYYKDKPYAVRVEDARKAAAGIVARNAGWIDKRNPNSLGGITEEPTTDLSLFAAVVNHYLSRQDYGQVVHVQGRHHARGCERAHLAVCCPAGAAAARCLP